MHQQHYTTSFSVDQSLEAVFAAINNVRGWWTGEIEGDTDKLGAEFTYRYQDVHRSTQQITDGCQGRKSYGMSWIASLTSLKISASGPALTWFLR